MRSLVVGRAITSFVKTTTSRSSRRRLTTTAANVTNRNNNNNNHQQLGDLWRRRLRGFAALLFIPVTWAHWSWVNDGIFWDNGALTTMEERWEIVLDHLSRISAADKYLRPEEVLASLAYLRNVVSSQVPDYLPRVCAMENKYKPKTYLIDSLRSCLDSKNRAIVTLTNQLLLDMAQRKFFLNQLLKDEHLLRTMTRNFVEESSKCASRKKRESTASALELLRRRVKDFENISSQGDKPSTKVVTSLMLIENLLRYASTMDEKSRVALLGGSHSSGSSSSDLGDGLVHLVAMLEPRGFSEEQTKAEVRFIVMEEDDSWREPVEELLLKTLVSLTSSSSSTFGNMMMLQAIPATLRLFKQTYQQQRIHSILDLFTGQNDALFDSPGTSLFDNKLLLDTAMKNILAFMDERAAKSSKSRWSQMTFEESGLRDPAHWNLFLQLRSDIEQHYYSSKYGNDDERQDQPIGLSRLFPSVGERLVDSAWFRQRVLKCFDVKDSSWREFGIAGVFDVAFPWAFVRSIIATRNTGVPVVSTSSRSSYGIRPDGSSGTAAAAAAAIPKEFYVFSAPPPSTEEVAAAGGGSRQRVGNTNIVMSSKFLDRIAFGVAQGLKATVVTSATLLWFWFWNCNFLLRSVDVEYSSNETVERTSFLLSRYTQAAGIVLLMAKKTYSFFPILMHVSALPEEISVSKADWGPRQRELLELFDYTTCTGDAATDHDDSSTTMDKQASTTTTTVRAKADSPPPPPSNGTWV